MRQEIENIIKVTSITQLHKSTVRSSSPSRETPARPNSIGVRESDKHKVVRFPWLLAVILLTSTQYSLEALCVLIQMFAARVRRQLGAGLHVPGQRTRRTASPITLSMSVKASRHKIVPNSWSFANFNSMTLRNQEERNKGWPWGRGEREKKKGGGRERKRKREEGRDREKTKGEREKQRGERKKQRGERKNKGEREKNKGEREKNSTKCKLLLPIHLTLPDKTVSMAFMSHRDGVFVWELVGLIVV